MENPKKLNDKCCAIFDGNLEIEIMPIGHMHYAKSKCVYCGRFFRWEKKPRTIENNKKRNIEIKEMLSHDDIYQAHRNFLKSILSNESLSPKQLKYYNDIKFKYLQKIN